MHLHLLLQSLDKGKGSSGILRENDLKHWDSTGNIMHPWLTMGLGRSQNSLVAMANLNHFIWTLFIMSIQIKKLTKETLASIESKVSPPLSFASTCPSTGVTMFWQKLGTCSPNQFSFPGHLVKLHFPACFQLGGAFWISSGHFQGYSPGSLIVPVFPLSVKMVAPQDEEKLSSYASCSLESFPTMWVVMWASSSSLLY